LSHAIITPGQPAWLDALDHAIVDLKPDSVKGYSIGDNHHQELSRHPWHLDDEPVVYPAYERLVKGGLVNVCLHKGLFSTSLDEKYPDLRPYCDVRDVGKAAKDWPQLNSSFIRAPIGCRSMRRRRWPRSTKPGASTGSPTWPTSRPSTG
jgi:hypothetical protein